MAPWTIYGMVISIRLNGQVSILVENAVCRNRSLFRSVRAKLSRVVIFPRRENGFYDKGNLRDFEIWGSNTPNLDGSWSPGPNWLRARYVKPSGTPSGTNTNADEVYGTSGWSFDLPEDAPKIQIPAHSQSAQLAVVVILCRLTRFRYGALLINLKSKVMKNIYLLLSLFIVALWRLVPNGRVYRAYRPGKAIIYRQSSIRLEFVRKNRIQVEASIELPRCF